MSLSAEEDFVLLFLILITGNDLLQCAFRVSFHLSQLSNNGNMFLKQSVNSEVSVVFFLNKILPSVFFKI